MERLCFGLIVGNRGFFPDHLCKKGREEIIKFLEKKNIEVICLSEEESKFGTVETYQDAKRCAWLFKKNKEKISGILVTLPNFGDEKGVAEAIRLSELNVPVLIHAWPDDMEKMDIENRRDSFCGKISVCNNLYQYGIKFTLTSLHTEPVNSQVFSEDIDEFIKICRIVRGLKNLKVGAIGTRPNAFKTMRYSEKILEKYGIGMEVIDMSEILAEAEKISDEEADKERNFITNYVDTKDIPQDSLLKMAKLKIVVERWVKENEIKAIAFQCWPSIQQNYGIMACSVLSIFSNNSIPAACEVDVTGALSMYILQLASSKPSAIVDWNNNYKDEENKLVFFHCSNFPLNFFEKAKMYYGEIIANAVGKENSYGTIYGRIKPGPFTYLRLTTDENSGEIKGYTGEGKITEDQIDTFGGYGVAEIPNLQRLLKYICENGFEHHVCINLSNVSRAIKEALEKYKNWQIYLHS